MTKTLSELSGDKFINSADLQARFDELESEREDLTDAVEEAKEAVADAYKAREEWAEENPDADALLHTPAELVQIHHDAMAAEAEAHKALRDWDEENTEELEALREVCEEGANCSDWKHGETLIREDYFPEYAEELCKDIGDLPQDIPSYIVIDWDATAENLKADYSSVTVDGTEYLIRSY